MTYKGFQYNNKTYVFHEKELYRLPYQEKKRAYGLHKCKRWRDGFILGKSRKSRKQVLAMIRNVKTDFVFPDHADLDF